MMKDGNRNDEQAIKTIWASVIDFVEAVLLVFVAIGTYLKWNHVTGGSLFFLFGCSVLSFLYLIRGLANPALYKFKSQKSLAGGALALIGFGLSCTVMGILFAMQFWPNPKFQLMLGIGTTAIGLVMTSRLKSESGFWSEMKPFVIKTVVVLLVGVALYFPSKFTLYSHVGYFNDDDKYMYLMKKCNDEHMQCDSFHAYEKEVRAHVDSMQIARRRH